MTYFELLGAASGYKADLERLAILFPKLDDCGLKQRAANLVKECFFAFKGFHRVQWSPGLKKKFDVEQALADLEAAAPDDEQATFSMATIEHSHRGWFKLWREHRVAELINLCRRGDAFVVAGWLRDHDIDGCVPRAAFEFTLAREDEQRRSGSFTPSSERRSHDSFNANHIGGENNHDQT
jgi:hypothetical protein